MLQIFSKKSFIFFLSFTFLSLLSISIFLSNKIKITNIDIQNAYIQNKQIKKYIDGINKEYEINMGKELSIDDIPKTTKGIKEIEYVSKNHFESFFDNLFYPYKSNIFRSLDEFEFLRDLLGSVHFKLVYSSKYHNDSATFFQARAKYHHMLVVLETEKGNRFGGYTSLSFIPPKLTLGLEVIDVFKGDEAAFLFNLDKKTFFDVRKGCDALYCDDKFAFSFGNKDLKINDGFLTNGGESKFPENFGEEGVHRLELTNGESKFKIKALEAFHIEFFKEFPDVKKRAGTRRKNIDDLVLDEFEKYNFGDDGDINY